MLGKKATQDDWYKAFLGFDEVNMHLVVFQLEKLHFLISWDFKSLQVQILYVKVRDCLNDWNYEKKFKKKKT